MKTLRLMLFSLALVGMFSATALGHRPTTAIKTVKSCEKRILKESKRVACRACVGSGKHYHQFGKKGHRCHLPNWKKK